MESQRTRQRRAARQHRPGRYWAEGILLDSPYRRRRIVWDSGVMTGDELFIAAVAERAAVLGQSVADPVHVIALAGDVLMRHTVNMGGDLPSRN